MTYHTREDEICLFKRIEETSRRLDNEIKRDNNKKFNNLMKEKYHKIWTGKDWNINNEL